MYCEHFGIQLLFLGIQGAPLCPLLGHVISQTTFPWNPIPLISNQEYSIYTKMQWHKSLLKPSNHREALRGTRFSFSCGSPSRPENYLMPTLQWSSNLIKSFKLILMLLSKGKYSSIYHERNMSASQWQSVYLQRIWHVVTAARELAQALHWGAVLFLIPSYRLKPCLDPRYQWKNELAIGKYWYAVQIWRHMLI